MKKKIVTLMIVAGVLVSALAGCGGSAEPANDSGASDTETAESSDAECVHTWTEATCAAPKTCTLCGETEGGTLEHTWTEATFAAPKTCTLCGETEGEREQSYFEEHGVDVPDAPVECTVNALIYNPDSPKEYQMTTDGIWEQIDCYYETSDEEGYQLVNLELCVSLQFYYDAAQDISYHFCGVRSAVYDWYTGLEFPSHSAFDDDFDYGTTLKIDGNSYDVSYKKDVIWESDEWAYDGSGNGTANVRNYTTYTFKVPDGYDGLVFAAIPDNEYMESNTETISEPPEENAEYAFDEDYDEDYIDGTKFFRINRQEDSPIMSGANAASAASSAESSSGAVIDDGREQGSIGESGLPYYRVGFSPEDFTIGGISVYDGKKAKDFCDSVDLPLQEELPSDGDAWYKWYGEELNTANFRLRGAKGDWGFVNYTDSNGEAKIFLSSTDGHTIAGADFIKSPIVPGETSFAEAVKLLGIEDLFKAMGIEGDAFKSVGGFTFESQFSESTHSRVSWGDYNNVDVWWFDKDGKEVRLTLMGEGDVIEALSISKKK